MNRHRRYIELRRKTMYSRLKPREVKRIMALRDIRFKRMLACNIETLKLSKYSLLLLQLSTDDDPIVRENARKTMERIVVTHEKTEPA